MFRRDFLESLMLAGWLGIQPIWIKRVFGYTKRWNTSLGYVMEGPLIDLQPPPAPAGHRASRLAIDLDLPARRKCFLLSTTDTLYRRAEQALDFIGDVLRLTRDSEWPKQRVAYIRLLRRFFKTKESYWAFISIHPFKKLATEETPTAAWCHIEDKGEDPYELDDQRRAILAGDLVGLELDGFRFGYRKDAPGAKTTFVELTRMRRLRPPVGADEYVRGRNIFLADPGQDHYMFHKGYNPADELNFRSDLRLITAPVIVLNKVAPTGLLDDLYIRLQPGSAHTNILGTTRTSLPAHLFCYPSDQRFLQEAGVLHG